MVANRLSIGPEFRLHTNDQHFHWALSMKVEGAHRKEHTIVAPLREDSNPNCRR